MTPFSPVDRACEEAAVRAVELDYDAAWSAADTARLLSLFTPDAVILNPYGEQWTGLDQIAPSLTAFLAGEGAGSTHSSRLKSVFLITPDVALVDGQATLKGDNFSGGELVHDYTDVLFKQDGVWRICHVRAYAFIPRDSQ